ncbi:MAG: DUF1566 domain-containing protein [Candidatus Paceibacterota bacterium]
MKNIKSIISYILGAVLVLGGVVIAGSLTPTESDISPTMVTLEDIYQKTQDFTYATNSHDISTESTPLETMHSLQDIWNSLTANPITSNIIVTGNTILGVEGSAESGGGALEWTADQGSMNWDTATAHCAAIGGRLPTIDELDVALTEQFINSSYFMDGFTYMYYWSSTEDGSVFAYNGSYGDGYVYNNSDDKSSGYSVRCVR